MTLPRLLYAVLFATACIPGSKSLGEGETDDPGTGETNGDDGPGSDDATPPDDGATSMVGGTDGGATTIEPEGTSGGGSDDAASTGGPVTTFPTSDGGDTGDTGQGVCEIVETACEMADQSKTPPVDCGDVTMDDPLATWQAAHDCVVAAAGITDAFKLVVDVQGIDSFPRRAFVGQVGFVYQMTQLDQDFGGINPGPTPITYRFCDTIVATPGCTTAVGDICLTCMGSADTDVLCEP